jgi:N4-gp56 family major capsid protein
MATIELATKYSKLVDERFYKESQAAMALNNDYKFTGVQTVKVYSIPVVPLNNYTRSGANRYGTPEDLGNEVQTLTVTQDKAWTFIIDKADKLQSEMVMDAGKACARQVREVLVPHYDTYVFHKLAEAAINHPDNSKPDGIKHADTTAPTKKDGNAYELFLKGQEALGDSNAPDQGRVCFCSYKFANLLKQDPAFMKYGDASQEMLVKGVMGEVDGTKIVKVPASRLPRGTNFILTHPVAACAPKILEEYKIHDNPPGVSGWLVN